MGLHENQRLVVLIDELVGGLYSSLAVSPKAP